MTHHVKAKGALESGLGLFSVGLGLAQLVSPCGVARVSGMDEDGDHDGMMRALGLRELASGIGILARPRPAGFLWARTLGDLMDLAILGRAMNDRRANRQRLAIALAAVGGVTLLDLIASVRTSRKPVSPKDEAVTVTKLVTIQGTPADIYQAWKRGDQLPAHLAEHLADVEIIDDLAGDRISWRSRPGAKIPHVGMVRFKAVPGDRGTEVRVDLHYHAPFGKLGAAAAKLTGKEPGQLAYKALRELKQTLETGDVVRSDASVHRGMHPARPSKKPIAISEGNGRSANREERMS